MKMVSIKMLRPTVVNGDTVVPDDIVETNETDAKFLCNIGKAELNKDDKKKKVIKKK